MKVSVLTLAAVAAMTTCAQAAPVIIDTFDNTNFQVLGAPTLGGSPVNPSTTSGPTADAIGGIRTITGTRTNPPGTSDAFGNQVQATVTNGFANVTLQNVEGFVVFTYGITGPLGADLTDGGMNDGIDVTVLTGQAGVTFGLDLDGTAVTRAATAAGTVRFGFAEYGGLDLASVDAINLFIEGPTGFAVDFDMIVANSSAMNVVPAPASLPLLLGGLAGFGALARRRRKA